MAWNLKYYNSKIQQRRNIMKKTAIASVAFIFAFSVLVSDSYAGHGSHERWEGVAIGLTVAIIGTALIQQNRDKHNRAHRRSSVTVYKSSPPRHHKRYGRFHHRSGHWEIRKIWVPPEYRKEWNPGRYNRKGRWKPRGWIRVVVNSGYWKKERVWVPHR